MAEVVIALDVPSGAGAAFRGFLEEAQCVGS